MQSLKWSNVVKILILVYVLCLSIELYLQRDTIYRIHVGLIATSDPKMANQQSSYNSILNRTYAPVGELKIYTYNDNVWKWNETVCANLEELSNKHTFQSVALKSRNTPLSIYIFDPDLDYISREIARSKQFDENVSELLVNVMKSYINALFVDIGSNIGVYTLQMADVGARVLAVDASHESIQHLCASVIENDMIEKISIIHNAIGSDHRTVNMVSTKQGNYGIHFIESEDTRRSMHQTLARVLYSNKTSAYKSVTLNDIPDMPGIGQIPTAFIKMDVEGYEHNVLKAADTFFGKVDVIGVYMEWDKHYAFESGNKIFEFFQKQNFYPFKCYIGTPIRFVIRNTNVSCILLEQKDLKKHIFNIMWMPFKMITSLHDQTLVFEDEHKQQ